MTPTGQAVAQATENMSWTQAAPLWVQASQTFAASASGTVNVFATPNISSQGMFLQVELPELLDNMNVSGMVFHEVGP
jgi:hypothetical protein